MESFTNSELADHYFGIVAQYAASTESYRRQQRKIAGLEINLFGYYSELRSQEESLGRREQDILEFRLRRE